MFLHSALYSVKYSEPLPGSKSPKIPSFPIDEILVEVFAAVAGEGSLYPGLPGDLRQSRTYSLK
jgi:hypothetical protein